MRPASRMALSSLSRRGQSTDVFSVTKREKQAKQEDFTPGPGQYDPPSDSIYANTRFHSIQNRPITRYDTISSNVEFRNLRQFPQTRTISIGARDRNFNFYEDQNTPGPDMPQPETLQSMSIRIGTKRSLSQIDTVPGPGQYNPKIVRRTKGIIPINKQKGRDDIWKDETSQSVAPGPGAYDTQKPADPPKRWTNRLRYIRPLPVVQLKRTINKQKEEEAKEEEQRNRPKKLKREEIPRGLSLLRVRFEYIDENPEFEWFIL